MSPPPEAVIAIGNIPLPSSSTHENELVGNEIVVSNDPAPSELRAETLTYQHQLRSYQIQLSLQLKL